MNETLKLTVTLLEHLLQRAYEQGWRENARSKMYGKRLAQEVYKQHMELQAQLVEEAHIEQERKLT